MNLFFPLFLILIYTAAFSSDINFSDNEKIWIKDNKTVKVCTNPNWQPIEFLEDKEPKGISIEILKKVLSSANLELEFVETKTWVESQEFLKEKKCDILPAATKTAKRSTYANFTKPYLHYKLAIITQSDRPFIKSIESVLDKSMSRKKGSGLISKLKKAYPTINIVETSGYEESLKKVSTGEVYYTIATLPVASHFISKFGLYNLHIAGYMDKSFNLSMAVRDDQPLLKDILQKGLDQISNKYITKLENEWSTIKIKDSSSIDYSLIIQILIVVTIIISFLVYRQMELKKHKKTLENKNDKIKMMLDTTMEGLLLLKDKKIIDGNQSAIELFDGKSLSDFKGKDIFEFISKESIEEVSKNITKSLTEPYEVSLKKLNSQKTFPALVKGADFTTEDEHIRIVSVLDLTKIKEKEQLLSQSSKMAQMGEMIGNIAHQWRQPLSIITTAASGIKVKHDYDILDEKELHTLLDTISTNANYLSDTIDTFRNFIKEKVELKEVLVQDRINNALNIIEMRIKNKHVELINNINYDNEVYVKIIVGELSQVIINIINNSIDALEENDINQKWIKLELEKNDDFAIITIEDNAKGIPQDVLPKIFEPYFTTKHQSQGTGIGLYMSYDIITNHMNGNIYAKNTENGAKFYIEIPLHKTCELTL